MRRREFITLLYGSAAAAWPMAVLAQRQAKLPTIGFLGPTAPAPGWIAAFQERLRELGWIEGSNLAIEYRWAEGHPERFAEFAAEFVRLKVDVIATGGTPVVLAIKQATTAIPIVFSSAGDPVGTGLVTSLARPGGNATGLSFMTSDVAGKRLELLHEVVPGLGRLAVMANASFPDAMLEMGEVRAVLKTQGLEVLPIEIRRPDDIPPAFDAINGARPSGAGRGRGSDVLWREFLGPVSSHCRFCRQDSARDKAGRYPGRAADQIRSCLKTCLRQERLISLCHRHYYLAPTRWSNEA
jgi:putative tryptophan/tyrosine transport system substrate-binding protein